MGTFTVFFVAFSLAMDAFAVSISNGLVLKKFNILVPLKFGLFFGFFQFIMTITGYFCAKLFSSYIIALDHWIAFILLTIIGSKMIFEAFKDDDEMIDKNNILTLKNLTLLSVATSIDALAVGVSFAFIESSIFSYSLIIGIVTFVLSFFGVILGSNLGAVLKKRAEILGGAILIFIGAKILFEHLS